MLITTENIIQLVLMIKNLSWINITVRTDLTNFNTKWLTNNDDKDCLLINPL